MRVFLSYRRSDVGGHAGRLSDALVQRLGARNVFQDVTAIGVGQDFAAVIHAGLEGCDAALAVIGPGWLAASTPEGRPRLFEPDDYVRQELATVLQRDLPVAPVLVGGASLPAAADLPEDLRSLVRRQAIILRDETWHQDVENLLRSLRGDPVVPPRGRDRRLTVALGVAALAAIVGMGLWRPWADVFSREGGSEPPAPPSCPDTTGDAWTPLALRANIEGRARQPDGDLLFTIHEAKWRSLTPRGWEVVLTTDMGNHTTENEYHDEARYVSLIVARQEFTLSCSDTDSNVRPETVGRARTGYVVSCRPDGLVELIVEGGTRLPITAATEPSRC